VVEDVQRLGAPSHLEQRGELPLLLLGKDSDLFTFGLHFLLGGGHPNTFVLFLGLLDKRRRRYEGSRRIQLSHRLFLPGEDLGDAVLDMRNLVQDLVPGQLSGPAFWAAIVRSWPRAIQDLMKARHDSWSPQ
jgi:hypothetical protein